MAQHEAKFVEPPAQGSGSAVARGPGRGGRRRKKKRSPLYYGLIWVGFVAIAAAVMVVILIAPRAKEALVAVTSRTIYIEPDETSVDDGSSGGTEADDEDEDEGADRDGVEANLAREVEEDEEVEIPVEPLSEEPDDEVLLETQPAQLPEGVDAVAASPEPDVGNPVLERVAGAQEWVVHSVAPQETVDQVAYRYGVNPQMLRIWNGIGAERDTLRRGARLKVKARQIPPPRRRVEYIVRPGDTWLSIAVAFGIDTRELRQQNWESSKSFVAGMTMTLWIDPLVYYWIKYDPEDPYSADPRLSVRRGAVGVGPPQAGRLINGVQIPEGEGYTRRMMPSSYGTTHAVITLLVALREFEASWPYEPELVLGSMSAKHGGPLAGHKSHQSGRDLDIRLPLDAHAPPWFPVQPHRVDYNALWFLLVALAGTGEVTIVFLDYDIQEQLSKAVAKLGVPKAERRRMLQYPRGPAAHRGLVRHASGHDKHIHVRFRCGPHEIECVEELVAPTESGAQEP